MKFLNATLFFFFAGCAEAGAETSGKAVWLVPALSSTRLSLDHEGPVLNPGRELASGFEAGVAAMTGSSLGRRIRIGLDLRQTLARIDGRSDLGALSTKLGVRLAWHFSDRARVGGAWFFGDTLVLKHRDRQYNGNSASLSFAFAWGDAYPYVEYSFNEYQEGPGFVFLARRPGEERAKSAALTIGIEFPLEMPAPRWLYQR